MRLLLRNLAALALGTVLAVLLLEGILRLYNPFETRLRGNEIVLPVEHRYVLENHGFTGLDDPIVHTKNSVGFRGPDPPAGGLAHVLGIFAVGGSTTECFYLSDGKDWPALIAQELARHFEPVWLDNAGLDGHSTFGHRILIRDVLVDLEPKVVLLLVGANEIGRVDHDDHTLSHLRRGLSWRSLEGLVKSSAAYSEVASLMLNLYRGLKARALGLPHRRIDLMAVEPMEPRQRRLERLLARHIRSFVPAYENRLRELVGLLDRAGIESVLITQPALYGPAIDPLTGIDLARLPVGSKSGLEAWRVLELYNHATRRVARAEGRLLIDLAAELPRRSDFYYDFLHFSNRGSEEVARVVASRLVPHLRRRFPAYVAR